MRRLLLTIVLLLAWTMACTKTQPSQPSKQAQPKPSAQQSGSSPGLPAGHPVSPPAVTQLSAAVATDTTPVKTIAREKTQGPFQLGNQSFTFVKRVLSVDRQPHNPDDETVEWWELRDRTGLAILHQSYGPVAFENGTFRETTWVDARALKAKFGLGILVEGYDLPSAPNSGTWVQVFGMFNGKLVSFSPRIATDGELQGEALESFTPTVMFRGRKPQEVQRDILNFRVWAQDFSIIFPVLVDWNSAKVRPAWHCLQMTPLGQIDRCRYKIKADPHREQKELTFVRLFNEPQEGLGTPAHIIVKPASKIQYLEAETPVDWHEEKDFIYISVPAGPGELWLHVNIDGRDGWIHTEEDFQAVGLEQAG